MEPKPIVKLHTVIFEIILMNSYDFIYFNTQQLFAVCSLRITFVTESELAPGWNITSRSANEQEIIA